MAACVSRDEVAKVAKTAAEIARDTAYVVVGLGVLAAQRAQVQRVAVTEKLNQTRVGAALPRDFDMQRTVDEAVRLATKQVQQLDGFVEKAVQFVETTIEPLEDQLPGSARDMAKKAHEQARTVRTQIRVRVVPAA
jgi:hypothetical protein